MTRHARNATNAAVYTYHERMKDCRASGYGTEKKRLSKDSIKDFDCCSLTLQPCRNPVVTPEGWLYDKEAILQYILEKKNEYQRKLLAYEAQKSREFKEMHSTSQKDMEKQKTAFEEHEKKICTSSKLQSSVASASSSKSSDATPSTSSGSSSKALPSFWIPSLTPQASETKLARPDKTVYCPMSGKPLKVKNLIDVKFTEAKDKDDANKSLISRQERYKCPVTNDILRNNSTVVILRPTGDAVTGECVDKIIRKDMIHPLNGQKLTEKDFIYLQKGGTGYAAANKQLKAEHRRPTLAIA